jgi:hypothetical protein
LVWGTLSEAQTTLARLGPATVARSPLARTRTRTRVGVALALLACACLPAAASGAPRAKLNAALVPERLGAGTTIEFGFTLTNHGRAPSPLTGLDLYYPANLGIATSGLGIETCSAAVLEVSGVEGCPSESRMGYGQALVVVPFGPTTLYETTQTTIFMAKVHRGHLGLLFYSTGESPVSAQIVFPGLVLPAEAPFGGDLATTIPLVPTLPGAPFASVVWLRTTLGPLNLTYYERTRGRYHAYHPRGVVLPRTCPRGGFQFAARFSFEDGAHTRARTAVPCPR